jgi:D-alanyl-D-alanine carboxypeptidase/D-alanyl-D-alanine-endopeptidase (penicillin-binding protein 4)
MSLCLSASSQSPDSSVGGAAPDSGGKFSGRSQHARLAALISRAKFPLQDVGIVVSDLDRDSVTVAFNPDSMVNPASVSKLLTTAVAFEKLGTNYSFSTSVYSDRPVSADSGICHGNFYVRGGADPYFVVERMWLFVQHLQCIGLKAIDGDIVLDDSFLDSEPVGPGFDEDDSNHPYDAPVDAVSANFNCESIWMRPGTAIGLPVIADILPKSDLVKLLVTAKTEAAGKPLSCVAGTQKDGNKTLVTISGGLPLDASPVVQYKKVWQTWEYFGSIFRNLLLENKIAFRGTIRRGTIPESVKDQGPLYTFPSVPLYQIVNEMMKVSNNYMAEMIFKTLSAHIDSTKGTWDKSAAIELAWWKEKKLPGLPKIKNGSGMGDSNRMSARQIVELLRYAWTQKSFFPEYVYALPSAGVDGTLKSRFKESRFKGIVRAKTGTLNDYGVSTIAGYVFLKEKTYAFAILFCNCTSHKQHSSWDMQEKILEQVIPEK